MKVQINGDFKELHQALKLNELLSSLNVKPNGVAVELNREVIAKEKWSSVTISDGDSIEIVHFVGGGSK